KCSNSSAGTTTSPAPASASRAILAASSASAPDRGIPRTRRWVLRAAAAVSARFTGAPRVAADGDARLLGAADAVGGSPRVAHLEGQHQIRPQIHHVLVAERPGFPAMLAPVGRVGLLHDAAGRPVGGLGCPLCGETVGPRGAGPVDDR